MLVASSFPPHPPIKYRCFFFFSLSFTIFTQDCSCESVCAHSLQNKENDKAIKQILTVVSENKEGRGGDRGERGRKIKCSDLKWTFIFSAGLSPSVVSDSLQPHGLQPARLLCAWESPGKNTGVGCHALLQGIFPTPGSNPGLPHCRRILYRLSHQGSPFIFSHRLNYFSTLKFFLSLFTN